MMQDVFLTRKAICYLTNFDSVSFYLLCCSADEIWLRISLLHLILIHVCLWDFLHQGFHDETKPEKELQLSQAVFVISLNINAVLLFIARSKPEIFANIYLT